MMFLSRLPWAWRVPSTRIPTPGMLSILLINNLFKRQRDRETERQRDREAERQRGRETERQRDREA